MGLLLVESPSTTNGMQLRTAQNVHYRTCSSNDESREQEQNDFFVRGTHHETGNESPDSTEPWIS